MLHMNLFTIENILFGIEIRGTYSKWLYASHIPLKIIKVGVSEF